MDDGHKSHEGHKQTKAKSTGKASDFSVAPPSISLPRGGGAVKNIDEKFSVNAINGTSSFSVPLPFSSARGYSPALSLSYSSGSGNGLFGLGWQIGVGSIKRRTDKILPRYIDDNDTDVFVIAGAEDLVPEYKKDITGVFIKGLDGKYVVNEFSSADNQYLIRRYRPRIEGIFARIERWLEKNSGIIHWQVITGSNVTTIYGKTPTSRIADPKQPLHIFEWLIDFTYDDKGHCSQYEYVQEDGIGIAVRQLHNRNRVNGDAPFTNTYLKRVWYGNIGMYQPGEPLPVKYMFENVFDYGEHDVAVPFDIVDNWTYRPDAFSDYRAGFEIRTCRLCNKILLYHHFAELPGGNALVKALHLEYDNNGADGFTFLRNIVTTGYTKHDDGTYTEKSLPPMSFTYSNHNWNEDVHAIENDNLVNAPIGLSEPVYQFTDLYSEGLSGILSEQGGGLFYKTNLGGGRFTAGRKVFKKPSYSGIANGSLQLIDLEANGIKQMVNWNEPAPGFFEVDTEEQWLPYTTFKHVPNINQKDANTKLIDLDGDGRPDLLITEEHAFTWYASEGKKGYTEAQRTTKSFDEEKGPAIVFADSTQSIFLSNMSGGGLSDIVRIRNGEICYWPNLGFGKFGAKVNMDNAPVFDHMEAFNPAMIKLADVDGSGTTDIIYLGKNNISIWFNQQGNSFSLLPKIITGAPEINQQTKITIADLLGTGMSCIVWSSLLPKHQGRALQYIDLLNSEKPHIMVRYENNLGKEVRLEYKPSTHYYIEDKLAGTPWVTKLHFPVHCVAKVTGFDRIMKTRFASEYSYHHGYYDHEEKEFRGFGRVDQKDAEDITHFIKHSGGAINNIEDASLHQAPVLTRSWFHTGAFLDRKKITDQFAHEYFQNAQVPEKIMPSPELPIELTTDEWRQALRACKGSMLRKEVYAIDGTIGEKVPYEAEEHNIMIKMLQPAADQPYAVFLTHECESISYHYERNAADPRVANNFILDTDDYGNILKSASVVYKRNAPAAGAPANEPEQEQVHFTSHEMLYTNPVDGTVDYRTPITYFNQSFELSGYPAFVGYLDISLVRQYCTAAAFIDYEAVFTGGIQKRILEFTRSQFRADDAVTVLPFGVIESKALKHQDYKAAFNKNILSNIYTGKISMIDLDTRLTDPLQGGYIFTDNYYWIPSGTAQYDTGHFFLTTSVKDPFGHVTIAEYDTTYSLFVKKVTDATGSVVKIKQLAFGNPAFNYRVLSPYIMMDVNDNETAVRFDELGMTVKSFVIGKKGIDKGDEIDESKVEIKGTADHPTVEILYNLTEWYDQKNSPGFDIDNYKPHPAYVITRSRETHHYEDAAHNTRWLETYSYADGGGHEVLKKAQAEPGEAMEVQVDGSVILKNTSLTMPPTLRWIGNGRSILNNKGNAVKKYEPYFTTSPSYDDEKEMVELGITPIIEYDPLDRVIKTTNPDLTFSKVEFTPWAEKYFDANDNVLDSGWYLANGNPNPLGPEPVIPATRAAWLSAQHYDTPEIKYLDSLGRTFLIVVDNKTELLPSKIKLDAEGNELQLMDALNRIVMKYEYDMLGNKLKQTSMDAGRRWMLKDVAEKPFLAWNDRDFFFIYAYDSGRRPVSSTFKNGASTAVIFERFIYGTNISATDLAKNLVGKVKKHYDQAGIVANRAYDFKGNLLESSRQFTVDYDKEIDWTNVPAIVLKADIFLSNTAYNANNKPIQIVSPYLSGTPKTVITPNYNEGNLLEGIDVAIKGGVAGSVIENINYNAKGQRLDVIYANNTKTRYTYYDFTSRLQGLLTTANNGIDTKQDISYVYDAFGNMVECKDMAQPDVNFDGELVKAVSKYTYNPVYQLKTVQSRKHAGQTDINHNKPDFNYHNHPFVNAAVPSPNDTTAFRNYLEEYSYDKTGNMLKQKHTAKKSSWTRDFVYDVANNHLAETSLGAFTFKYIDAVAGIDYDAHGNMGAMEHLKGLDWNFKDELSGADLGGGGKSHYVYDSEGQRVRKVIERLDGTKEEKIYLGITEIVYKISAVGAVTLQRESVHIMDNKKRAAIIDIPVIKSAGSTEQQITRYQYDNYLGSVGLELDEAAKLISYEEYFPFGSTSYSLTDNLREIAAKQYRYTGKEKDDETGLNYHGSRYYATWLCRWISADPAGLADGNNMYLYVNNHPTNTTDPTGMWEMPSWRTVAVVAAVVVVGTIVTVATAGAAGPLVVGAVASIGLTGTAATVATGVVVGAVAGGVGGYAGSFAGEATRQTVNNKSLGLGKESYSLSKMHSEGVSGAKTGAKIGAAVGGVAAFATTTAGAAVIGAVGKTAQKVAPTLSKAVVATAKGGASVIKSVAKAPVIRQGVQLTGKALQGIETAGQNLGTKAAQGLFKEGTKGGIAVSRFAATKSYAEAFKEGYSRSERLSMFKRDLLRAPASQNPDDAIKAVNKALDNIENVHAGPKDRMFGILDDKFVTRHGDGSVTALTKGHRIEIQPNGGFSIFERTSGKLFLTKQP